MQARFYQAVITAVLISFGGVASAEPTKSDAYREWVNQTLLEWAPLGRSYIPEAKETLEEGMERYRAITEDAIAVAFDPREKPLFLGPYGRSQTLALILSTAWWESGGYRRDVDLNLGKFARGDHGRSWCLMQIQLGNPRNPAGDTPTKISIDTDVFRFVSRTADGLTGGDLIRDRRSCFRAGLHVMRGAFQWCKKLPLQDRLSGGYTSNRCIAGQREARDRFMKAKNWISQSLPPFKDAELESAFQPTSYYLPGGLSTRALAVGTRLSAWPWLADSFSY